MCQEDIKKLEENDYVVITVKSMDAVKLFNDIKILDGNQIFKAAIKAIRTHNGSLSKNVKEMFTEILFDAYLKNNPD